MSHSKSKGGVPRFFEGLFMVPGGPSEQSLLFFKVNSIMWWPQIIIPSSMLINTRGSYWQPRVGLCHFTIQIIDWFRGAKHWKQTTGNDLQEGINWWKWACIGVEAYLDNFFMPSFKPNKIKKTSSLKLLRELTHLFIVTKIKYLLPSRLE